MAGNCYVALVWGMLSVGIFLDVTVVQWGPCLFPFFLKWGYVVSDFSQMC